MSGLDIATAILTSAPPYHPLVLVRAVCINAFVELISGDAAYGLVDKFHSKPYAQVVRLARRAAHVYAYWAGIRCVSSSFRLRLR